MYNVLLLIGRICMCSLFMWAASTKILDFSGTSSYMASKEMPYIQLFLPTAIFLQVVGSLLLLIGYKARLGAWLLILFIIPAAIIFHNFWALQGHERLIEQIMFMKDVATLGGLLAFAASGPGRYAFEPN